MNRLQWMDFSLKAIALVVGGLWVIIKGLVAGIHRPRLRMRVSAQRVIRASEEYVIIKTELENVGLFKVDVSDRGCCLKVSANRVPRKIESIVGMRWKELALYPLFESQNWVEPEGLLIDSQLVGLQGLGDRFVRISAHFESESRYFMSRRVALNAYAVVPPLAPGEFTSETK